MICVANAWQMAENPQEAWGERLLGKGEVVGSIPPGSTITTLENHCVFRFAANCSREQKSANVCGTRHKKRGKCVANRGRCSYYDLAAQWQIAYGLAMAATAILILPVVVVLLMAGVFG